MYSEKVMDHFNNPRNVGEIENPSGVGTVGNAKCGDIMRMYLDIDDNGIIQEAKFKTFGCGAAVATSSMATELVKGKTIQEALQVTNKAVMEALDGLPPVKVHCSLLAEEAIHAALWDYAEKHNIKIEGLERPVNDISEKEEAPADENVMEHIKAITKGIRNVRAEMDVPNSRKTKVYVVCQDEALCNGIEGMTESVKPLMNANEIIIEQTKEGVADNAVSVVVPDAVVYLPLEDLVDFEQELERLKKEEDRLNKEIKRAEGMLANERFVSKAPADKVQAERDKLEKYTEMLAQVKERMEGLGK